MIWAKMKLHVKIILLPSHDCSDQPASNISLLSLGELRAPQTTLVHCCDHGGGAAAQDLKDSRTRLASSSLATLQPRAQPGNILSVSSEEGGEERHQLTNWDGL